MIGRDRSDGAERPILSESRPSISWVSGELDDRYREKGTFRYYLAIGLLSTQCCHTKTIKNERQERVC